VEIAMNEAEFHDATIKGITRLEVGQTEIVRRLDGINGSVKTLFGRVGGVEVDLARHPIDCPIRSTVEEIQRELSTGDHPGSASVRQELDAVQLQEAKTLASKKTSRDWLNKLMPVIYLFLSLVGLLIFQHADTVLRHWSIVKP
jgi:hypothetical protein